MKKKFTLLALLLATAGTGTYAQLTAGANTTPGSTLDVRGSVAAQYRAMAASGPVAANDFYVSYTGSGAGTISLPAAGSGMAPLATSFKGRLYTIKNATAAQTLTVTPAAGETIDGKTSLTVAPGQSVQLVSTGNTPAAWEVVSFTNSNATASNGLTLAAGDVKLGGTLSQNTELTTAGYNLALSGAGKLGVGLATATQPNSTLQVAGSSAATAVEMNASGALGNQTTIRATQAAGIADTLTLPAVAGTSGRYYNVSVAANTGATTTLQANGSELIYGSTGNANTFVLNAGQSATFTNINGSYWQATPVVGQMLRFGLNGASGSGGATTYPHTNPATYLGLRFNAQNSAAEMGIAPSGQANFINTIPGAYFTEAASVPASASSGLPARTADRVHLPAGTYRIKMRFQGGFNTSNTSNSFSVFTVVNNNVYNSITTYGINSTYTRFNDGMTDNFVLTADSDVDWVIQPVGYVSGNYVFFDSPLLYSTGIKAHVNTIVIERIL